jgi:hypothetical protein
MARGGIFRRVGRAIRNVFTPSPRAPEPPREPRGPREPPRRGDDYKDIWREHGAKGRHRNYQKNLKVFHNMVDPIEDDSDERLILWDSYVRNMVKGEGRFRRQDTANMWWRDSGLDPRDFNWQAWREAMGFTGKRRSRTP